MGGQNGQLGPNLEAQEAPRSRPKPEKIKLSKRTVFDIDFARGRAPFGKGFWKVFQRKFVEKCKNALLAKSLKIVIFPREN